MVVLVHAHESVYFVTSHGLNDKPLVVAKEEKATTASSPLPSLKDLVSVFLWAEALRKDVWIVQVLAKRVQKELSLVECDLDIPV